MVITITMKNLRERNGIFEFRMAVPKDCQESVGQTEITQTLKTKHPAEAATLANGLTNQWKAKFDAIRKPAQAAAVSAASKTDDTVGDFRKKCLEHIECSLHAFLEDKTDDELYTLSEHYGDYIGAMLESNIGACDFTEVLGITMPLPKQKSPGMTRKLNKVVSDMLGIVRLKIDAEAGRDVSREIDERYEANLPAPVSKAGSPAIAPGSRSSQDVDIAEISKLMIAAKNTAKKNREMIANEVMYLQEWLGGKSDITQFTKADLIDYIQNCLPYSPKNMRKKSEYDGKSLSECVAMVRNDPSKYVPISHRTCENRLVGLISIFNYAKNQLALIPVNFAMGVSIPKVRVSGTKTRSYTGDELATMWDRLKPFSSVGYKYPERYWVTVLALYHGCRVNEICSLHLKDIYRDEDDIWVMDIKEDGVKKTVKTASSVRIVPVHPFVLNTLDFIGYINDQNSSGNKNDLLFPNLTYTDTQGYAKNISAWFRLWKKTWLPLECHHKNFHSLRHTFIQQAQNQSKMPDRYNQEITGHAVTDASKVHLGYSGSLKPKDILVELEKVKYGWE